MRQAAIYAVLIASALNASFAASAGEDEEKAPGIPWVAHLEYGGYSLLQAPLDAPGPNGYQLRMVHGITAQPWRLLMVNAAWRYRESYAPGFSAPFREPVGIQGATTVEWIPGFIYSWLGMSWPLIQNGGASSDSLAWDAFLSHHATLPDPSLVDPAMVQIGSSVRFQVQPSTFLAGLSFAQSSTFKGLGGEGFRPPWVLRLSLQVDMPLIQAKQRLNFQGILFGSELTHEDRQAHTEGSAILLQYSASGLGSEGLWAASVGVTARLRDANRRVMLDVPPVLTQENDNFQNLIFSLARAFKRPFLNTHYAIMDKNSFLWNPSQGKGYFENTLELHFYRRVFAGHALEFQCGALGGTEFSEVYYGLGGKIVFTFRHLGLEDRMVGGGSP